MFMIPVLIREHMVSTRTWPLLRSGSGSSVTLSATMDDGDGNHIIMKIK